MMLTGEKIDAQKALDFGLLNYLAKNKNVAKIGMFIAYIKFSYSVNFLER